MKNPGTFFIWLIFTILVILKVTGEIAISWFWVFSPLWGALLFVGGIWIVGTIAVLFIALLAAIINLFDK